MSLRETLDKLEASQYNRLMHAFNQGLAQYVELPGKRFIGVNVQSIPNLIPDQTIGAWSEGVVK